MNLIKLASKKWKRLSLLFGFDNWLQLLFNRFFFRGLPLVFYRKGTAEFLVDHAGGDQDGLVHCFVPGLYDPFFAKSDRKHSLKLLDLGANSGGFPLAAKSRGYDFSRIVAVELNPFTASRLRFNLLHNFGSQAIPVNAGLTEEEGRSYSFAFSRGSVADSLKADEKRTEFEDPTVFEIPSVTLDQLIVQYFDDGPIDICKMDVEGEEFEVILGTHANRLSMVRDLLIEIHEGPGRGSSLIEERLQLLGFHRVTTAQPFFELNVSWWRNARLD